MNIYTKLLPLIKDQSYFEKYRGVIEKAKTLSKSRQKGKGFEEHHILPQALFPENKHDADNKVLLTYKEHFLAHKYLWKAIPNKETSWAYWCMCTFGNRRRKEVLPEDYEEAREAVAEIVSKVNSGKTVVYDPKDPSKRFQVDVNDPKYLSGELVHMFKDTTVVYRKDDPSKTLIGISCEEYRNNKDKYCHMGKDKGIYRDENGNTFKLDINDPIIQKKGLKYMTKGRVTVYDPKDPVKKTFAVDKDDPRYISGEVVSVQTGKVVCFHKDDPDRKLITLQKDDPRWLSGDYCGKGTDMIPVRDKDDPNKKYFLVERDHPKFLSGQYIHNSSGMITVKDNDGNTMSVSKDDPRYLSGDLVGINKGRRYKQKNPPKLVTCPHCGKTGRPGNMAYWHFNNCKLKPLTV